VPQGRSKVPRLVVDAHVVEEFDDGAVLVVPIRVRKADIVSVYTDPSFGRRCRAS
jgi:hypothetical protein